MEIMVFICGVIYPFLVNVLDFFGNNFDAHFSDKFKQKTRVKDESFLRKLIPLKEGSIIKNGTVVGYRYFLYPRAIALVISAIILIVGIALFGIDCFIPLIDNTTKLVVGFVIIGLTLIYQAIMSILSQGLHI